jgi:LAS superfamily LD-carboxypeptidase LdcB
MKYPYQKLVLPSSLKGEINGRLNKTLLERVATGGKMIKPAAVAFNAMYSEALKQGVTLRNIGDYRSYEGQLQMFLDRYEIAKPNDPRLGKRNTVTRKFEGKVWILKKGKAPSAAPDPTGKSGSNHGWGLAIDLAVEGKGGNIVGMASAKKGFKWMCENAPKYGFFLQGDNPKSPEFEAWHWQYCLGDATPPALQV